MGLVKEESVGVVTQNCKQRATQTRATTETTATTETAAVMRAKTMRKNERSKNHGRDKKCRTIVVVKNLNCGFCVSKLESTTSTMLYSHLGRCIFICIQTNVGQIYVNYLELKPCIEGCLKRGRGEDRKSRFHKS